MSNFNSEIMYESITHFRKINWLPASARVEYCIANTVLKLWNRIVPMYVHEMCNHLLYTYCKRSHIALGIPLPNININQKTKK